MDLKYIFPLALVLIASGTLVYQNFSGPETAPLNNDTRPVNDTQLQISSEFDLEYVFTIETEEINQLREENNRTYYQTSLRFELTEFGQRVSNASSEEEVEQLVRDSFESYPEEDFVAGLMSDVEVVQDGRPEDVGLEALTGRIENLEGGEGPVINMEISVRGSERPEVRWSSLTWRIRSSNLSEAAVGVDDRGSIQTDENGVIQTR